MAADSGLILRWTVFVSALYLAQVAFVNQFRILGVHPELMLLVAIGAGIIGGSHRGAAIGFASGLLVDFSLHGSLGATALSYTLVGFAVGSVQDAMVRSSRLLSSAIAVLSSALGVITYAAVTQILGSDTFTDPDFLKIVLVVSAVNGLLCVPMLRLCRRVEGARLAY